jgi:hypothetical protein
MAPKLAAKSVAFTDVNITYAELSKFVQLQNPNVVNNKPDTALDFNLYIITLDLQKTNVLVTDFLNVSNALRITFLVSSYRLSH